MPSRADGAPSWLYLPELGAPGTEIELGADESHYVTRVCRMRDGERAQATDGRGAVATLTLLSTRGAARARVESSVRAAPARRGGLLCGAPEGGRADWMVEKLAELGLERLVLVDCARSAWPGSARQERLDRLAVAGLRQSRRAWKLSIEGPTPLARAIASLPPETGRWLASEGGPRGTPPPGAGSNVGAVGPAEGFDASEESRLLGEGFRPMALADGRLRCETAAVAWSAWWALGAS
jgi:16S rRNA (uracil1498-N3)-methyltransferase